MTLVIPPTFHLMARVTGIETHPKEPRVALESCFSCFWYKYVSSVFFSHPHPCRLSPSSPSALQVPDRIDIWWAAADVGAREALPGVFQKGLGSYFTVSGLRRCHVLIKIQIPLIDCVIRLAQPRPAILIWPVIYDHLQEKSFCVIIWGNRAWASVILQDLVRGVPVAGG